jgi:hypothetical protein
VSRPDFSEYVVHFTKDVPPAAAGRNDAPNVVSQIAPLAARDRLFSMLRTRIVAATPMPYTGRPAIAFTECVWASLLDHASTYSRLGIGFTKDFLFQNGGGPAFYMRQDLYRAQVEHGGFDDNVWPFITPFVPAYASDEHVAEHWGGRARIDYSHEREWRVPHDLSYEYGDVAFVIVPHNVDADEVVGIGGDPLRGKILLMDNYDRIKAFWPG